MYLNQVTIIGNLTRDPELKALPSGSSVASFGVATNRVWRDKDGNKQEDVEFHNCVVFGKQADNVARYMKKGNHILVQGRLQTRSWEHEGHKNYRTEIVANTITFGRSNGPKEKSQADKDFDEMGAQPPSEKIEYPTEHIDPNDIPF